VIPDVINGAFLSPETCCFQSHPCRTPIRRGSGGHWAIWLVMCSLEVGLEAKWGIF